ncbi:MAG: S-methyl-5-thioribose-1-phosphate isomerase [Paracoccaceae bacterium]|nr:S-methyl-5-thioribose-1-phosphate isomerase [Paracoccaceae bacterium]
MKVEGNHFRSIWFDEESKAVNIIDQRVLPHEFKIISLDTLKDFEIAIKHMAVRGAPLIGATAAFGMACQMRRDPSDECINISWERLHRTRPTAINLKWALDRCRTELLKTQEKTRAEISMELAKKIANEDVEINRNIGIHGLNIIQEIARRKSSSEPVRLLTHCNAGWLATVDWGTATSPMFQAHENGVPIHVWVDETRPRNQGALTSWELQNYGISHNYITDNAGGHLMQHGLVDMIIVGTDRTTSCGDVCNKIGTYLKALAAKDNGVPFYVALPSPTIDWTVRNGVEEIPIEERVETEVSWIHGLDKSGRVTKVKVTPDGSLGFNPAFDVTPAKLVTGLITERGVCDASESGLRALFPDLEKVSL